MTIGRLLREPLLHFLILGLALFSVDKWRSSNTSDTQIEVTQTTLNVFARDRLGRSYDSLNAEQQQSVLENYRVEEGLFREAYVLGITQTDDAIRIRMIEQITQFAEQRIEIEPPNEAEINIYFQQNNTDFKQPASYSFRHLFFSGDDAKTRAEATLERLKKSPRAVPAADRFMFQSQYANRSRDIIVDHFGEGFTDAVENTAHNSGVWSGPISSRHGHHLVNVKTYTPARLPSVKDVYSEVAGEILRGKRLDQRATAIDDLTSKYEIAIVE